MVDVTIVIYRIAGSTSSLLKISLLFSISAMSLLNQTCWVVGGVGVIGRGIAKSLLQAGATVIVNSRSIQRLEKFSEDLDHPDRLYTVHGSLLPGYASKTVEETLRALPLNHVVAHGAVRYWAEQRAGYDETHSMISASQGKILQMSPEEFRISASHLASLHFSAAQELIPRIQFSNGTASYTFVTGDGNGHPGGKRSAFGEINAHHVWGLSAAIRSEPLEKVNCREVRVELAVNRPEEERKRDPRPRPLSDDIGTLCAGLASNADVSVHNDAGELIRVFDNESLEPMLTKYGNFLEDESMRPIPATKEQRAL